jgi:hypothetical protein
MWGVRISIRDLGSSRIHRRVVGFPILPTVGRNVRWTRSSLRASRALGGNDPLGTDYLGPFEWIRISGLSETGV